MIDKISKFARQQDGADEEEAEDDELKMNKGYHIEDMLGYPSLLDKIKLRIEEDEPTTRPRGSSHEELQSPLKNHQTYQKGAYNISMDIQKQISQHGRKKINSYDRKTEKTGGLLQKYKALETKFILDFNSRDDLHDLYESINLQKKTEMLTIMLKRSFGQLECFRNIEQNVKPESYGNLMRSLKTLVVKQGSTIFSFGSVGKQYYFLIKGSVYILLRTGLGSKINNLEKGSHNHKQDDENAEQQKHEKKRQIQILRKKNSIDGGGLAQQSIITTTQKKTKFLTYANKLQNQESKVFGENYDNTSEKDSPSNKNSKFSWDFPSKKMSLFQQQSNSSTNNNGGQDLQYLLQLQHQQKKSNAFDDSRSQKSVEDRISISWSLDSQRNKEEIKKKFPHFQIVGTHNPGDGFGELSLLKGIKRTATIVAKEDSFFLTLDKDSYLQYLAELHEKIYQEKINFVKQFFIFEQLDKRLPSLIILFEPKSYTSGQCIYQPGDEVNYLYLIKKGSVSISRKIAQKSERGLIKQVEDQDSVAQKYLKEIQQSNAFKSKSSQSQIYKDQDSEILSKQDMINEYDQHNDTQWDGKMETEDNECREEDIKDLQYSQEKGVFVGKNNKIFSMMRNLPLKDRHKNNESRSRSVSPKKNMTLTTAGEYCFFGEEEIVSGEKFRQYEAKVTSSKVEVLCISLKNLKIITKYNDVMARIKAYYELKNVWRHNYVERSQNALLIQEYLAKNFKDHYVQNILNKESQQRAAIEMMAKNLPHSMDPSKQAQSVLNRKLYIKQTAKQIKQKQTLNTHNEALETESQFHHKNSLPDDNYQISPVKFQNKSPEKTHREDEIIPQRNKSTVSPHKIDHNNATADISCTDFDKKIIFLPGQINQSPERSKSKILKDTFMANSETKPMRTNTQESPIKKSLTATPGSYMKVPSTTGKMKSMLSQIGDRNENSNKVIKISRVQNNNTLHDTLTTNQNEQSIEDLHVFSTQQKQIFEQTRKNKQSGDFQICDFLDEIEENQDKQALNRSVDQDNLHAHKGSHKELSPEIRVIMEKQALKQAAESEQKEQKTQKAIINYQQEQINQMEKLRGILIKDKKQKSNQKRDSSEKILHQSQDLDFREIHNIFINIEGIKSKKVNKYTKQYREAKEKFSKEPRKKHVDIPKYNTDKAQDILKNKERSSSFYKKKTNTEVIQNTPTLVSRQRSNSNSSTTQPQRKFSFRQYIEKQKSSSSEMTTQQPLISQFKGDTTLTNSSIGDTKQSEWIQSKLLSQTNPKTDSHQKQIVVQLNDRASIRNQEALSHRMSNTSNLYHTEEGAIESIERTQDYYFQKTPNRRYSLKQNKELDRIIEKENSMIFQQDQQDNKSEILIDEGNKVEESDIDQVRNMLLLVKKLKIDHLMETKYTDQTISAGVMNKSINIMSIPTTARSASQRQRRKVSSISDKKDLHYKNDDSDYHKQTINQGVSAFNSTCINFKDESVNNLSYSRKIFNVAEREQQQRRKSSGAIFRPTVPISQFPLKAQKATDTENFALLSKYSNFHHF